MKSKKSGIYKITINNKGYVGFSKDLERRCQEHEAKLRKRKHCNTVLQNAFNKYNEMKWEIIEECENEKTLLQEREKYWIKELGTFPISNGKGYNLTEGGDGGDTMSNHPRKKELGEANSERMKERHAITPHPMLGKTHTEESRKKISESNKGREVSEETRRKMSESNMGRAGLLGEKSPNWGKLKVSVEDMKKACLEKGTLTKAAKSLGINHRNLGQLFERRNIKVIYNGESTRKSKIIGFETFNGTARLDKTPEAKPKPQQPKHPIDVIKKVALEEGTVTKAAKVLGYSDGGSITFLFRKHNIKTIYNGHPGSFKTRIIGFEDLV